MGQGAAYSQSIWSGWGGGTIGYQGRVEGSMPVWVVIPRTTETIQPWNRWFISVPALISECITLWFIAISVIHVDNSSTWSSTLRGSSSTSSSILHTKQERVGLVLPTREVYKITGLTANCSKSVAHTPLTVIKYSDQTRETESRSQDPINFAL